MVKSCSVMPLLLLLLIVLLIAVVPFMMTAVLFILAGVAMVQYESDDKKVF